jgi:inorganic pyrophosphatase
MSPKLHEIDPGPKCPDVVRMIVEIPKLSRNKYEYDVRLGLFKLDRTLYSPMHYPGDYGFVPGTVAADGDPVDVLVLSDEGTFTGCLMEVRPVGLLEMADEKGPDEKILAVPDVNPRYEQIHTVDQVFPHVRREIEHFFDIYKELEGKHTEIKGWRGPMEARRAIANSRQQFLEFQSRTKSPGE